MIEEEKLNGLAIKCVLPSKECPSTEEQRSPP
jgi:hypothetical protein